MDYANQQKALLNQVIDNACINRRDLLSNPDKDFIRDRKLPLKTMLQIIISMQGGSINRELYDYDKTIDVTSSAFVQQRDKITPEMFRYIFQSYNRLSDDKKRHNGYKLLAVDGSDVNIAKNPDSETYMENGDVEGFNQFHINALYAFLIRPILIASYNLSPNVMKWVLVRIWSRLIRLIKPFSLLTGDMVLLICLKLYIVPRISIICFVSRMTGLQK